MVFRKLRFSCLKSWSDAFEGGMYEHLRKNSIYSQYFEKELANFAGSCWTLHQEDPRLFESMHELDAATKELLKDGSAAMWEAYCRTGGVRIKTTIRKVLESVLEADPKHDCIRGKVFYEPAAWISRNPGVEPYSFLFKKRISFRFESEYRIIVASNQPEGLVIPIFDFDNFIDEYLISPAIKQNAWISKSLYMHIVDRTATREQIGMKCRISSLYSLISEEISYT